MENNSEGGARWVDERIASLTEPPDWEPDSASGLALFRRGRQARRRRSRLLLWGGVPAVAVIGGLMAFPGPRVLAQRCVRACLAQMDINPKAVSTRDVLPPAIRLAAPDFALADERGRTVSLSGLRGQVVALNFWATWCGPCRIEIPWFSGLARQYGGAGLTVVGVAMDDDGWTSVRPGISAFGITYPVVLGNEAMASRYGGVEALPTTFLIDRSGRIAAIHQGLVELAKIEAEIGGLLEERD